MWANIFGSYLLHIRKETCTAKNKYRRSFRGAKPVSMGCQIFQSPRKDKRKVLENERMDGKAFFFFVFVSPLGLSSVSRSVWENFYLFQSEVCFPLLPYPPPTSLLFSLLFCCQLCCCPFSLCLDNESSTNDVIYTWKTFKPYHDEALTSARLF